MPRCLLVTCVLVFLPSSTAWAGFIAPTGYATQPLNITGDGFGVSAGGRLIVTSGNTVSLYSTWKTGRTLLGTLSDARWSFTTDSVFTSENQVVFGENGSTDTLWSVDFTNPASPTAAALAPNGTFPAIQGVALSADHSSLLISGSTAPFGSPGGLYLSRIGVGGGAVNPIVTGGGTGFVGGAGFTPSGKGVLLDTGGAHGAALLFDLGTNLAAGTISIDGPAASGAYAIAFAPDGRAFVTAGAEVEQVDSIDSSPTLATFGTFSEGASGFPFPTGIAFTGASFRAGHGEDGGALVVNGGFTSEGGLFAVVPVPEPTCLAALGAALLLCRRTRRGNRGAGRSAARALNRRIAKTALVAGAGAACMACAGTAAQADSFFASNAPAAQQGAIHSGLSDPAAAFGAPLGGGDTMGSLDVFNLGVGGSLTLGFDTAQHHRSIVDEPGNDFIVFENPFFAGGDGSSIFAELVFVEVSTNGVDFARLASSSKTPGPVPPFGTIDPADVNGFAGVNPVYANADENTIDPFDPLEAGGDAFDLQCLGSNPLVLSGLVKLNNIRYVRLVDVVGDGTALDRYGNPVYDPCGTGNDGADIDALAVIHGASMPEPGSCMLFAPAAAVLLRRKERRAK